MRKFLVKGYNGGDGWENFKADEFGIESEVDGISLPYIVQELLKQYHCVIVKQVADD